MVEVEAAEEVLVRLTATGVLGDDDAWDGFEDFAAAGDGAQFELFEADGALGGGLSDAEQAVAATLDEHLGQGDGAVGAAACGGIGGWGRCGGGGILGGGGAAESASEGNNGEAAMADGFGVQRLGIRGEFHDRREAKCFWMGGVLGPQETWD